MTTRREQMASWCPPGSRSISPTPKPTWARNWPWSTCNQKVRDRACPERSRTGPVGLKLPRENWRPGKAHPQRRSTRRPGRVRQSYPRFLARRLMFGNSCNVRPKRLLRYARNDIGCSVLSWRGPTRSGASDRERQSNRNAARGRLFPFICHHMGRCCRRVLRLACSGRVLASGAMVNYHGKAAVRDCSRTEVVFQVHGAAERRECLHALQFGPFSSVFLPSFCSYSSLCEAGSGRVRHG
jgi:hypothetical protein